MEKPATNLTKAQIAVLVTARDSGHAFADTGCRQRAGGSRMRMIYRLRDQGLLTWNGPYKITEKGLKALRAFVPDQLPPNA